MKITSGLIFFNKKVFSFNKSRLPWAALVVLMGLADVTITLIGQPAAYWANHATMIEDDFIGRMFLDVSPWLFLAAYAVFHFLEGWLVMVLPKWLAVPVAAYCIACGIIAVFFWLCIMGFADALLMAGTVGYAGLIVLMVAAAAVSGVRFFRK